MVEGITFHDVSKKFVTFDGNICVTDIFNATHCELSAFTGPSVW